MATTINDRITAFIAKFDLTDTDELRDDIMEFVTGCWGDHFKFIAKEPIPENNKPKGSKIAKADKIEDPSECKERDDLRNCTAGTLNEYCKKHSLRIGGNKKEVMDRVWRFLQGVNSDDDMSPRNKPKKEKKNSEKHDCCGCTSKGTPCAVQATVQVDDHWFCWRHEETAKEIIAATGKQVPVPSKKAEPVKVEKKKAEKKAEAENSEKKASKKGKKVPEPEPEPELESENEEEVEIDNDDSEEELVSDEE